MELGRERPCDTNQRPCLRGLAAEGVGDARRRRRVGGCPPRPRRSAPVPSGPREGVGDALGAVGVGGCHRRRHAAQYLCLPGTRRDGAGDALGAVGVGGRRRLRSRRTAPMPSRTVGDGVGDALGAAEEPGGAAGSVAATAAATQHSADTFADSSVMELAMRSDVGERGARRGRGRWPPAAPATPHSANAFRFVGDGDALGSAMSRGAVGVGGRHRRGDVGQRRYLPRR